MTSLAQGHRGLRRGVARQWTPAHAEAARFLGGCTVGGALLGLVTEAVVLLTEERHGLRAGGR